ncbi:hypothetical protein B0J11DRAFT_438576 [Dendryphion nanum]|uniref:SRR1-like domain-containing protein n=1 Tax=Dendryphion nanum TaxID=256645 RepID=A0A9P9IGB9_9PLEO|nr:hypothetical protein B0J11DRAFT_438576 [Dendryphion nanum]
MEDHYPLRAQRKTKSKPSSREIQQLHALLADVQATYTDSQLSQNMDRLLESHLKSARVPITNMMSLGLGSLFTAKGQTRRIKQLTIFLAIRDSLQRMLRREIEIYAQDPAFTRTDEALLSSLGIHIARTPSGSQLGEAASLIDTSTIIYSPFLTLEAYEQLLLHSRSPVQVLIGDDFNGLLNKWPKHTAERAQVEGVARSAISKYRRRAIGGEGFWITEDQSFPMAMYSIQSHSQEKKAKL